MAALLFAHPLLAHQPQLSLWAERGARLSAVKAPVRTILPEVRRSGAGSSTGVAGLPADFLAHVQIRSVRPGTRPGTVLILEDVHGNPEAQKHLSAALIALGDAPGERPVQVALEGASGGFVFDRYHRLPENAAREVADSFLETGDIGGPSHAGFVTRAGNGRRGLRFIGAESPGLYRLNVAAYRASVSRRDGATAGLAAAEEELSALRAGIFSNDLMALDDAAASFDRGDMTMGDFADMLEARGIAAPESARSFLEAWRIERSIDFPRVDAERRVVLEKLIALLKPADIEALVRLSLGYRDGSVSFGRYYAELKEICRRAGVRLEKTPAFDRYLNYVLLSDGVDAKAVLAAVDGMRADAYRRAIVTESERVLVDALKRVRLASRLARFSLMPEEWRAHEAGPGRPGDLSSFESFYRAAESRNDALAASLRGDGVSVLVVGGFHTDGVMARLTRENRNVVVCSPRLTAADMSGATAYLSVFEREKMPLEKIFAGRRLFLSPPPAGAAEPLIDAPDPVPTMESSARLLAAADRAGGETDFTVGAGHNVIQGVVSKERPADRFLWKTLDLRGIL